MPGKMTNSILRPPFRPPQVPAAVRSSRLSCGKVGKAQIFTSARESSGESPLKRIGVNIAALPLVLGIVNRAVAGSAGEFEHRGAVGHQPAAPIKLRVEQAADAAMVDDHGADRAAALDKAKDADVLGPLAARRPSS
jgi:hypothetical protein